jgi:hypothetical protein
MITYPGSDAPTVAVVSGQGVWSTVIVVEGGDKRNAGNLMAGVKSLVDRTNLLYDRMIDIKAGGTYTLAADVTLALAGNEFHVTNTSGGFWSFDDDVFFADTANFGLFAGFSTLNIGYLGAGCHAYVNSGSDIIVKPGAKISIDGTGAGTDPFIELVNGSALTADSGSTLLLQGQTTIDVGGSFIQKDVHSKVGDAAVTKLRVKTIPATTGTVHITASEADIWEIPVLTGAVVLVVDAEASNFEFTIRQKDPSTQAYDCQVEAADLNNRGQFLYQAGAGGPLNAGSCRYFNRAAVSLCFIESYFDGVGLGYAGPATFTAA